MERTGLVYTLIVVGILVLAIVRSWLEKKNRLAGLFKALGIVEISVISLLLGSLIFFGVLQILLRNLFGTGINWAEPLMRHIVLWIGCLGGAMATTKIRHISIDIFTRYLPDRLQGLRDKMIYLATAAAASVLGLATLKLVVEEKEFSEAAFLNVQEWVLQSILPFAFFLITYRSLLNLFLSRKAKAIDWEES